jgi:hypothetical protein
MAVHQIGIQVPDLKIPRMTPCSAITGPDTTCGATPVSLYQRYCTVPSHARKIWICPVHVMLAAANAATCRECAARGGSSPVLLQRLSGPVRIP